MKAALTSILLGLAATAASAQPIPDPQRRPATSPSIRLEKMPQPRPPAAGLAFTFTDDADSVMLPAFAMRTTPLPTRLVRLGVQWKF